MAWIVVVPPSPATHTSATKSATSRASGTAPPGGSRPGAEHWPSSGPSSGAVTSSSRTTKLTWSEPGPSLASTWRPGGGRPGRTSTPPPSTAPAEESKADPADLREHPAQRARRQHHRRREGRWPSSSPRRRSTPICRCLGPSSTPPWTTTTCPARPWCARAVPAAPPPPATSRSPAARSGCCASNSTGWSRRSIPVSSPGLGGRPDRAALGRVGRAALGRPAL